MDILTSSDSHRDTLVNVLSTVSIPGNTTNEALTKTIGKMVEFNSISFQKDELPARGMDHNIALHITIKCGYKVISCGLVDGGSGANICMFSALRELGIHIRELKESHVRVRAFDRS